MIIPQTLLNIADNTGAKIIMCIQILGSNKKVGNIGDLFIGVIKKTLPKSNLKKATIIKGLIVRVKKSLKRNDGTSIQFSDNAAILLNKDNSIKGTRILTPLAKEIRFCKYSKILTLKAEFI